MKICATLSFRLFTILLIQDSNASDNSHHDGKHLKIFNIITCDEMFYYVFLELNFLRQEVKMLRDENRDQTKEIAELKEMVIKMGQLKDYENRIQNKEIAKLKEMLAIYLHHQTISDQKTEHINDNKSLAEHHEISERFKRPVRLLPPRFFRNDPKNETDQQVIRRFYGPPTNCSELAQLGYTLNGFYLVQSNNTSILNSNHGLKIETIYCAFKQPDQFNPNAVEKRFTAVISSKFDEAPSSLNKSSDGGALFQVQLEALID